MTTHTQGKLSVLGQASIIDDKDNILVDIFHSMTTPDDARRLVACWNVCDGLDTDYIEYAARTNNFVGHVEWLISERDAAKTELASSQERRRHQSEEIGKLHSQIARLKDDAAKSAESFNLVSARFAEMQAINAELLALAEMIVNAKYTPEEEWDDIEKAAHSAIAKAKGGA